MKEPQYVIKQLSTGEYVKWGDGIILFDTQEEAEELIIACPHPCMFAEPLNVEICKGVFFVKQSVNYKWLKGSSVYRQMLKLYGSAPMFQFKEDNTNG